MFVAQAWFAWATVSPGHFESASRRFELLNPEYCEFAKPPYYPSNMFYPCLIAQTDAEPLEQVLIFAREHWGSLLLVLVGLLVLLRLSRSLARFIRRRRPPRIHPRLQKYNVDHAELLRQQQEAAGGIIATSTTARLAGYRIEQQVEAVFVEGYRTPEEAMTALKASAAQKGANAILNVHTERTAAGRCTAGGDAVRVVPAPRRPASQPRPTSNPPSSTPSTDIQPRRRDDRGG
jgi:uncharacterized protein YbjQ (UPF0145 family)